MRVLSSNPNVDNSDVINYPDGRIKDNTGSGDGTGVNERVYGDIHSTISKLLRLYAISPNNLPDNEANGFQIIDALRALGTKNTSVQSLTAADGKLVVPFKINYLLVGETMICKAAVNFASETEIKGSDITIFGLTVIDGFSSGDYVLFVKTSTGVELRRVVDQSNLDTVVGLLNYLKKATQSEENAGTIDTKATTPLSNLTAFIRRVIGTDSGSYLATAIRNGLYPKEHFSIVAAIGANPVRNIGTASGIDINSGAVGTTYAVSGNIVSATKTSSGDQDGSIIRVVVQNTMTDNSYFVRTFPESLSANQFTDSNISTPTFKVINATTFDVCIKQVIGINENLKLHFEVVKIQ